MENLIKGGKGPIALGHTRSSASSVMPGEGYADQLSDYSFIGTWHTLIN